MATVCTKTDEVVCHCLRVTASQIQDRLAITECDRLQDVMKMTDAGTGCTACHARIRELIASPVDQP